jgi:single-stranded-DNA-specific exonuclease
LATEGVSLILTVDNGIAALTPIMRAKELGLQVIITDHHDLPPQLPPADAILNPKLLAKDSPYRGLAGVGVAYILAVCLAQALNKLEGLTKPLLELFTVGTIADLAPLTGVNRRWLKRGLKLLPYSQIPGIKALNQLCGLNETKKNLNSDDIGFKIGPRINAVGRIGDPQIVIELLTTEDEGIALERAMQCHQINSHRQSLCQEIEQEAIDLINQTPLNYREDWVLVVIGETWNHGVIGIVASRLVDRYGVPVFIGTYEEENKEIIRGSARGIEEFNVFSALQYCDDLLGKYGGHKAAGGFSFPRKNLALLKQRLKEFAQQNLAIEYLKPLVKIDAQLTFQQANLKLLAEINSLYPWGIDNQAPIFWTPNVKVLSSRATKDGSHLQLTLTDETQELKAIAWGWSRFAFLPPVIDVAYQLKENDWNGDKSIQLEIVGIRSSQQIYRQAQIRFHNRQYTCSLNMPKQEIKIINQEGKELSFILGESVINIDQKKINIQHQSFYQNLINTAINSLTKQ